MSFSLICQYCELLHKTLLNAKCLVKEDLVWLIRGSYLMVNTLRLKGCVKVLDKELES